LRVEDLLELPFHRKYRHARCAFNESAYYQYVRFKTKIVLFAFGVHDDDLLFEEETVIEALIAMIGQTLKAPFHLCRH